MEEEKKINLMLFSYHKPVFNSKVREINFNGEIEGNLTILCNHVPIICAITSTPFIVLLEDDNHKTFQIEKGVFYFKNNIAKVLASNIKLITKA